MDTPTEQPERAKVDVALDGRPLAIAPVAVMHTGDQMFRNRRGETSFVNGVPRWELYEAKFDGAAEWVQKLAAGDLMVEAVVIFGDARVGGPVRVLRAREANGELLSVALEGPAFTAVLTVAPRATGLPRRLVLWTESGREVEPRCEWCGHFSVLRAKFPDGRCLALQADVEAGFGCEKFKERWS